MFVISTDEAQNGNNGETIPEKLNSTGPPHNTKETTRNEDINEEKKGNF